jgi:chaperonin cofactor prefoldin
MKDLMTGNELDTKPAPSQPWNPAESVGKWLRETGSENVELKKKVETLEKQVAELDDKRKKQFAVLQEVAQALKLKFPDPKLILQEVKRLTSL